MICTNFTMGMQVLSIDYTNAKYIRKECFALKIYL